MLETLLASMCAGTKEEEAQKLIGVTLASLVTAPTSRTASILGVALTWMMTTPRITSASTSTSRTTSTAIITSLSGTTSS